MTFSEKINYIQDHDFNEWLKMRRVVEDEISNKQSMFCVCGRLATGLHESMCRKFHEKISKETVKMLSYLLPVKK